MTSYFEEKRNLQACIQSVLKKTLCKILGYKEHEIVYYVICVTKDLHAISKEHDVVRTVNYRMSQLAWHANPMRQEKKPTEH